LLRHRPKTNLPTASDIDCPFSADPQAASRDDEFDNTAEDVNCLDEARHLLQAAFSFVAFLAFVMTGARSMCQGFRDKNAGRYPIS